MAVGENRVAGQARRIGVSGSMVALPPSARLRARLLDALLPIAAERGWSDATVREAAEAAGLDEGERLLAAQRGALDMIDAFAEWGDDRMAERLESMDLLRLKIRERVKSAVLARLEAIRPWKAAEAKALQAMARPFRAPEGARFVWRTADRIWRLLGDRSTDENYYSKRAILSGVLASTTARWFLDESEDSAVTRAFLDRRIENVMQFERLKGQVGPAATMAAATARAMVLGVLGRRA